MVSTKRLKALCLFAASTTVLLAAGCQQPTSENDTATSKAEISEFQTVAHTQEISGARAECTLYADQFDGPTLSSLGTNTLDLILADSHSCNPLVVYMDLPDNDPYAEDRRLAVGRYLEDRGGLKSEQIEFHSGGNPAINSPAVVGITNYQKTDTATDNTAATTSH
ncbi:MAG TPA: hypothetical protein VHX86_16285 [Tepidisphaeraceae bacterium]|nr:hypothetical protein [Tepidisphaeraceae bacterium]